MEVHLTKKDIQTKTYDELRAIADQLDDVITKEYKRRLRKLNRSIVQSVRPGDLIIMRRDLYSRSGKYSRARVIQAPKKSGCIKVRFSRKNIGVRIVPEKDIDYVYRRGKRIVTVSHLKKELGL